MTRASSKVRASDAAQRSARASASSSSYWAATRIRFSRPSSRSSGSRSAPSTASVAAMTSIHRRASSSETGAARRAISRRAGAALDLGLLSAPSPERREPPRARARGDRAAVPARIRREPVPEILALEEQVRRGRRDRRQHPAVGIGRHEDAHELPRQEPEPIGGERREGRDRALPEEARFAEDPVEERPLELLRGRPVRRPSARARVDPDERLGVEEERLQDLERAAHELGVGVPRHPSRADLDAARGEDHDREARREPARRSSRRTSRGEPQTQAPSSAISSARSPPSHTRISKRARASAFSASGSARAPEQGRREQRPGAVLSTTRPRATAERARGARAGRPRGGRAGAPSARRAARRWPSTTRGGPPREAP